MIDLSHQYSVTTPRVAVKLVKIFNLPGTNLIQMNVANQLLEVPVFLTNDRVISVLEEMTVPVITQIEPHCISCKQTAHEGREPSRTASQQNVCVVAHYRPRINSGSRFHGQPPQTGNKVLSVSIIIHDASTLDPPDGDVMKRTG
jgi:hypothetical protein